MQKPVFEVVKSIADAKAKKQKDEEVIQAVKQKTQVQHLQELCGLTEGRYSTRAYVIGTSGRDPPGLLAMNKCSNVHHVLLDRAQHKKKCRRSFSGAKYTYAMEALWTSRAVLRTPVPWAVRC